MVGFNDSDSFVEDTLDNWPMSMGANVGYRVCSADIKESAGLITNHLGGISPIASNPSGGNFTIQLQVGFKKTPLVFCTSRSLDVQAVPYGTCNQKKNSAKTRKWGGASFSLVDQDFYQHVIGR